MQINILNNNAFKRIPLTVHCAKFEYIYRIEIVYSFKQLYITLKLFRFKIKLFNTHKNQNV